MSSDPEENFVDVVFDLMHVLQQALRKSLTERRLSDAITGPRLRILWTILKTGPMRMSEIALIMGVQPRTVTQFIDSLESAGLVARNPDPTDRRAVLIRLSEAAVPIVRMTREIIRDLNSKITGNIESEDLAKLIVSLKKIRGNCE